MKLAKVLLKKYGLLLLLVIVFDYVITALGLSGLLIVGNLVLLLIVIIINNYNETIVPLGMLNVKCDPQKFLNKSIKQLEENQILKNHRKAAVQIINIANANLELGLYREAKNEVSKLDNKFVVGGIRAMSAYIKYMSSYHLNESRQCDNHFTTLEELRASKVGKSIRIQMLEVDAANCIRLGKLEEAKFHALELTKLRENRAKAHGYYHLFDIAIKQNDDKSKELYFNKLVSIGNKLAIVSLAKEMY